MLCGGIDTGATIAAEPGSCSVALAPPLELSGQRALRMSLRMDLDAEAVRLGQDLVDQLGLAPNAAVAGAVGPKCPQLLVLDDQRMRARETRWRGAISY